jgi:hypothetical protein
MKKQKMNDDSLSLVLCWIKMQTNSLKTFVADRVATIQNLLSSDN